MKKLNIITGLFAVLLSPAASAISVGGLDLASTVNNVTGMSGGMLNYTSVLTTDTISFAQVTSDLTDADPATYVLSLDPGAYIDMSFTGTNAVYNGLGNDLALFFAGNNDTFSIMINGTTKSYNPQSTPTPWTVSDQWGSYNLTVALVELDDFGLTGSQAALGDFRVYLGDQTRPALSLVGGFHTQPYFSQVPLPLPALLFASGLGLIGAFGRKRTN